MSNQDTSIGGGGRRFDTTQWSKILAFQGGDASERRRSLKHLVGRYWKPVYTYVRIQWRRSNEDSKDLTQQFFASLIEGDVLERLRKERGRFRSFLRVALKHFMANEVKAERAIKRGGGLTIAGLDAADSAVPADAGDPAAVMDQEWKRTLVSQALEELRVLYRTLGQDGHYLVFEAHYFGRDGEAAGKAIAERFGLTQVQVKRRLEDARDRFRGIVQDLVAETVTDEEGLRLEIRELFGPSELP